MIQKKVNVTLNNGRKVFLTVRFADEMDAAERAEFEAITVKKEVDYLNSLGTVEEQSRAMGYSEEQIKEMT
jgi:hypothetical protein